MPSGAPAGMPSPPISIGAWNQASRSTRPAPSSTAASVAPPSTSLAQLRDALAGDAGVGILDRQDDAANVGGDQRIGAGRRLAPMAARLEADIGGGAARRRA